LYNFCKKGNLWQKKTSDELNRKVSKLSDDVSRGKGAVAVLIGIGTIIAACIGYFSIR
jgi:hypothetical protein